MMRWMKAKKYRFVKPGILTTTTLCMLAQMCMVPTLLAMESAEYLQESLVAQGIRDERFAVRGGRGERTKELRKHVLEVASDLLTDANGDSDTKDLVYLQEQLKDEYARFQRDVGSFRSSLVEKDPTGVLRQRLDAYIDREQTHYLELNSQLREAIRATGSDERRARVLENLSAYAKDRVFGTRKYLPKNEIKPLLPSRQREATQKAVSSVPIFEYPWIMAGMDDGAIGVIFRNLDLQDGILSDPVADPEAADTSPAAGIDSTNQNIVALAVVELESDPVKIFEYVRNTIVYESYFGSVKGASRTLLEGTGNDLDQASLLAAMLRSAGIPARLSFGTIEMALDDAADWLGVSDPSAMLEVLQRGGTPAELRSEVGQPVALRVDHAWVTAYVDLEPFRGAREGQEVAEGDTWLDLDPSFKQHAFESHDLGQALSLQPTSLFINSQIDATINPMDNALKIGDVDGLNEDNLFAEMLASAGPVRSYLARHELSAESIFWSRKIADQRFGLFPISDEYKVVSHGVSSRAVPAILTHQMQMVVYGPSGNLIDGFGLGPTALSFIAGDRIVLGYQADEASQGILINSPFVGAVINVNPELYVGDQEPITNAAVGFRVGESHVVEFRFWEPGQNSDLVESIEVYRQSVRAGSMHAFVLNPQDIPEAEIMRVKDKLESVDLGSITDFRGTVHTIGDALDAVGRIYFHQADRFNEMTAGAVGVYATRLPSLARVSWEVNSVDGADITSGPIRFEMVRDLQAVASRLPDTGGDEGDRASRYMLVSSILANTLELAAMKQGFFANSGASVNVAVKEANISGAEVLVTVAPDVTSGELDSLFGSGGSLEQIAIDAPNLEEYIRDFAGDGIEVLVLDGGVDLSPSHIIEADSFIGVVLHEQATGNNSIRLFDTDDNAFAGASVHQEALLEYDGQSGSQDPTKLPGYAQLITFDPAAPDRYTGVLESLSGSLGILDAATTNSALWYLPAVATVNEWFENRSETEPVTIPLASLMLSQPIDQFSSEPSLLDFAFQIKNPYTPAIVGNSYDGAVPNADRIDIVGSATRSDAVFIEFFDPTGAPVAGNPVPVTLDIGSAPTPIESFNNVIVFDDSGDGLHSYRAYATGGGSSSIPVEGEFMVDRTPPVVAIVDPTDLSSAPQQQGSFRVDGSMYDFIGFDKLVLELKHASAAGPDDPILDSGELSSPQYDSAPLWMFDTSQYLNADNFVVIAKAWDSAGNMTEISQSGWVVDNPPDANDIQVTISGFQAQYESTSIGWTDLSASPIALADREAAIRLGLQAEVDWGNYGDQVGIQRVEVLVNDVVIQAFDGYYDQILDISIASNELLLEATPESFFSGEIHNLGVRVFGNFDQSAVSSTISFEIEEYSIEGFSVAPVTLNRENSVATISARVQDMDSNGGSGSQRWRIYVLKGSDFSTAQEFSVPEDAFSGEFDWDGLAVPSGNHQNGGTSNIVIDLDVILGGLASDDGDYWVELRTGDDTSVSGESAFQKIVVDFSNHPHAILANLTDTGDVADANDLEFVSATTVDDGFFNLYGYAYDDDATQQNVRYRIEIRPVRDAIQVAEFYDHLTPSPRWFAIPPADPDNGLWGVRGISAAEDADDIEWRQLPDGEQFRPNDGGEHLLARLDLTGLPDGEFEVALIVESNGGDPAVDLGRLALSSPAKVGRFTFSQEDISLPTTGFPMSLVRTYDSLKRDQDGPFGLGWSLGIFDLDIEVQEVRKPFGSIYPNADLDFFGGGDVENLNIRNSNILDRAISLTLPSGERVTFPFYLQQTGTSGQLSAKYRLPPRYVHLEGSDTMSLTAGFGGIGSGYYLNALPVLGYSWNGDPFNANEFHHDIPGWILVTEEGIEYTIKRVLLHEGITFQAEPNHSQFTELGKVWGKPYVSKIKLPTGERIDIQTTDDGVITGFNIRSADPEDTDGTGDLIRFVYSDSEPKRIIAAFGPSGPAANEWANPLYVYEYDEGQLARVARVLETNPGNYGANYQWNINNDLLAMDITTFVYDGDEPGLITSIVDPRGLQPVQSEYDDAGRLVATIDQYGRRVEIARDVEAKTETVSDFGAEPPIVTTYVYDEQGNVTEERHSSGKTIIREYDDENRLLLEHDLARDNPTTYFYGQDPDHSSRELTRVTDPLGNITETSRLDTYLGVPVSIVTTQILVGRDPIVTEQIFDNSGNLRETISGTTRVGNNYDGRNRLIETLVPEISDAGLPTDNLTVRTRYNYENANPALLSSVEQISESGSVTTSQHFEYDHLGRQYASYTVAGDTSVIDCQQYDAAGRVVGTYRKIELGSNPTVVNDPATWGMRLTTTEYNAIDQVIASIDHVGGTTSTTLYDLRGNVIETAVWPVDLVHADQVLLDDLLSWLKKPMNTGQTGIGNPPDLSSVVGTGAGPVVTRTAYNDRGQAVYTSESKQVLESEYRNQAVTLALSVRKTEYDTNGRAAQRYRGDGTVGLVTRSVGSSVFFDMQASVSSEVLLSSTVYDTLGRVHESISYNAIGGAEPITTSYVYDENDRQRFVRVEGMSDDGSDLVTEYEYDEAGRQIAVIGPDGNRVEYEYDSEGRRTHTNYADPSFGTVTAETLYDPRGRRVSEIDQAGNIKAYKYDHDDRLSGVTLVDPTPTAGETPVEYGYIYDGRGNLESINDPNGSQTDFTYDHLGRRISRTLPGTDRSEHWVYYAPSGTGQNPDSSYGKLEYHQDFNDNVIHYAYDEFGRVEFRDHYFYTGDLGTFSTGTPDRRYEYTYDNNGRVERLDRYTTSMSTPDRSTAWVYDDRGRLEKLYQPEGILVYEYQEPTGRLAAIKSFDGNAIDFSGTPPPADRITTNAYTYDKLGRLQKVVHFEGATPSSSDPTWTYSYTNLGARKSLAYTDGTNSHVTLYGYDTLGRLTKLENWEGTEQFPISLISSYHYTHNADGRRASVREVRSEGGGQYSGMLIEYGYDPYGRLVAEESRRDETSPDFINGSLSIGWTDHPDLAERDFDRVYIYDASGNRLSRATDYALIADEFVEYSYAGSTDQLFSQTTYAGLDTSGVVTGTELYAYDANGFMTRKEVSTDAAADLEWTHVYTPSVEGRLATYSRTDHDGANDISPAITYDYNESGIRVRAADRYFLVDSLNPTGYAQVLVERVSLQGAAVKKYALGDDVLGQGVGTSMQSLLMDGHGSTRQLYSGSVIERYDYDAYGEAFHYELDKPDSVVGRPQTDLLYAGEQWDADLGMQYLRARYYLPGQGVFNRLDPFFGNTDDPQSLHKYVYTHGDPVNGIDPSGLFSIMGIQARMAIGTTLRNIGGNILRTYTTRAIFSPSGFGVVSGTLLAITLFTRMTFIWMALKPELMRLKGICGTIPGPAGRLAASLVGARIDKLDRALLTQSLWTAASPLVSLIPLVSLTVTIIRGLNFASILSDTASFLSAITGYLSASASASGPSYYSGAHVQLSIQPKNILEILRDNMIPYRANPAFLVREFSGMLQSGANFHAGSNPEASQILFNQHAAAFDHELASYWIDIQHSYRRYSLP